MSAKSAQIRRRPPAFGCRAALALGSHGADGRAAFAVGGLGRSFRV
jgi:hypothetical protein